MDYKYNTGEQMFVLSKRNESVDDHKVKIINKRQLLPHPNVSLVSHIIVYHDYKY